MVSIIFWYRIYCNISYFLRLHVFHYLARQSYKKILEYMTEERDFFCFFEETCNIIGKTCSIIGKHISQRRNLLLSKFFGSAPTLLQPCSSLSGWRGVGEELEGSWRGTGERLERNRWKVGAKSVTPFLMFLWPKHDRIGLSRNLGVFPSLKIPLEITS